MFKCVECGLIIYPINSENSIIEYHECRIDLEFFENSLIGLQLGPSKE